MTFISSLRISYDISDCDASAVRIITIWPYCHNCTAPWASTLMTIRLRLCVIDGSWDSFLFKVVLRHLNRNHDAIAAGMVLIDSNHISVFLFTMPCGAYSVWSSKTLQTPSRRIAYCPVFQIIVLQHFGRFGVFLFGDCLTSVKCIPSASLFLSINVFLSNSQLHALSLTFCLFRSCGVVYCEGLGGLTASMVT